MDKRTATKMWIDHWQRVGPILEKIRHDELRAMTEDEARRASDMLIEFALSTPTYQERKSSGFVEQQRLFKKLAARKS